MEDAHVDVVEGEYEEDRDKGDIDWNKLHKVWFYICAYLICVTKLNSRLTPKSL